MTERLLKLADVEHKTGRRKSTIYRDAARGTFPRPIKVGASSLWPESAVDRWISKQIQTASQDDAA